MESQLYPQIKDALRHLDPQEVRELAERPVSIGLIASGNASFVHMADTLVPRGVSRTRRCELAALVHRVGESDASGNFDITFCEDELLRPDGAFCFYRSDLRRTVHEVLAARPDLEIALARNFQPFRQPVIARIVRRVALENAAFALVSAFPGILSAAIQLPHAAGDFSSDTAFMTMNQVRMAFLIAAASDQEIGYGEQSAQIAAIVGGAVGWRAAARKLEEKISFGGGVIPKVAVAWAGTWTIGVGLERFYRIGADLTRAERREVYARALARGREIVASLIELRDSASPRNAKVALAV
jgi:hypothetical protein